MSFSMRRTSGRTRSRRRSLFRSSSARETAATRSRRDHALYLRSERRQARHAVHARAVTEARGAMDRKVGGAEVIRNPEAHCGRDRPGQSARYFHAQKSPGGEYLLALLDDHGHWRHEIRRLTRLLELAGIGMLFLMATATGAVIIAAATSSLASNREIVSVLNFVGAEERSPGNSRRIF